MAVQARMTRHGATNKPPHNTKQKTTEITEPVTAAAFPARTSEDQKTTTTSSIQTLNFQPDRKSVVGKSLYFCVTYSAFMRMPGVMNHPPPICTRSTFTSLEIPGSSPVAVLYRPPA